MDGREEEDEAASMYTVDQQIRTLSTMGSLVGRCLARDEPVRMKTQIRASRRDTMFLANLLCRQPGENVTVASAVDALSSRPYFELVVATNMDQDLGSRDYKYLFAPGEISDADVISASGVPMDGFDRHIKVFGTFLRAYHTCFSQPQKRAKVKRAFLTYSLGASLPEFVHRLSFGVENSTFISFLLSEPPHLLEDFEPLVFKKESKEQTVSLANKLIAAIHQLVLDARSRQWAEEFQALSEQNVRRATQGLKRRYVNRYCVYCLHVLLGVRLRWVLNDAEMVLSALFEHRTLRDTRPDELHWTTTILKWGQMLTELDSLICMFGTYIDSRKDRDLLTEYPFNGAPIYPFEATTYPCLSFLFKMGQPPEMSIPLQSFSVRSYGDALASWLAHTSHQSRAARYLLHSRVCCLATISNCVTIIPLSTAAPADQLMQPYKQAYNEIFDPAAQPTDPDWPMQLKTYISTNAFFEDLWHRRFPGNVLAENQVLMWLASMPRHRRSYTTPAMASTRIPTLGSALVSDALVAHFWMRPAVAANDNPLSARWNNLVQGGRTKPGIRSGAGASTAVVPFCLPLGMPLELAVAVRDQLVIELKGRLAFRKPFELGIWIESKWDGKTKLSGKQRRKRRERESKQQGVARLSERVMVG